MNVLCLYEMIKYIIIYNYIIYTYIINYLYIYIHVERESGIGVYI